MLFRSVAELEVVRRLATSPVKRTFPAPLLVALAAFSACTRPNPAVTEADIVAAVIHHVLTAETAADASTAKPLFVGVPGNFDAPTPLEWYRDPPSAWLERLPAISPLLQPFSRARISSDSSRITDASDSPSSQLLLISAVQMHSSESASVDVGFVSHVGDGYGWSYDLSREHGVWRVTGTHGAWNS